MSENDPTAQATPPGAGRSRRDAPLGPPRTAEPVPWSAEDADVAWYAVREGQPRSDEATRRARRTETRRGWVLWVVIGVPVALVAAVVLFFVLRPADGNPAASATTTTTLPVPTATTEPLDRADATALVQALPGTVRQFVLTTVDPVDSLAGATEGWTAVYEGEAVDSQGQPVSAASTGEASAGETSAEVTEGSSDAFTVTVGQWEDGQQAAEAAASLSADLGTPTSTQEVTVGDEVTGSLSFYEADGSPEGTAVWTNGTVVLRAVGPSSEIVNFATGFGL